MSIRCEARRLWSLRPWNRNPPSDGHRTKEGEPYVEDSISYVDFTCLDCGHVSDHWEKVTDDNAMSVYAEMQNAVNEKPNP